MHQTSARVVGERIARLEANDPPDRAAAAPLRVPIRVQDRLPATSALPSPPQAMLGTPRSDIMFPFP